MNKIGKFVLLFVGCFLLTMAIVPLVKWGVVVAIVTFYKMSAAQSFVPELAELIPKLPSASKLVLLNLVYSLELALGLLFVKLGLK